MSIPDVSRQKILEAFTRFDKELRPSNEWQGWEQRKNHLYAVEWNSKKYPVKEMIRLATGIPPSSFKGGRESNSYLTARGFRIIELHKPPTNIDTSKLDSVLKQFKDFREQQENVYLEAERDYKVSLFKYLHNTFEQLGTKPIESKTQLINLMSGNAVDKELVKSLDNLLTFQGFVKRDDFKVFLENIDLEQYIDLFSDLFNDQYNIKTRISEFRGKVNSLYAKFYEASLFSKNKKGKPTIPHNLLAIFLAGYDSDKYILYKPTEYEAFFRLLGVPVPSNAEEKYEQFLQGAEYILRYAQEHDYLVADLIDVHNLIYMFGDGTLPTQDLILLASEPEAFETYKPHQEFLAKNQFVMSWFSYPIGDEYRDVIKKKLPVELYVYGTITGGRRALTHRFVVNDFYTQKGDGGMESPEPVYTLENERGLKKMGSANSTICKTWLKVSQIEELDEPIPIERFGSFKTGGKIDPGVMLNSFVYARKQKSSFKYPFESLMNETYFRPEFLQDLETLLEDKKQIVLFGPPGTGKTYVAEKLALYTTQSSYRIRLIQFHPSYCYEEFIEGLRPLEKDGKPDLEYQVIKGIFRRLCDQAFEEPNKKFVLSIDEINRGNIPKIFGELLYLLEYRGKSIQLPISQESFHIPGNVYIIGTMNTSDRSIASLDFALRRRFFFVPLFPADHPEVLRNWLNKNYPDFNWVAEKYERLNELIEDDHIKIGYSYFMCQDLNMKKLDLVWRYNIVPLLKEYYFSDPDRIKEFERAWFGRDNEEAESASTGEGLNDGTGQ